MAEYPHLPVLRAGREYASLDQVELRDHRLAADSEPIAVVSQANSGIIKRDMKRASQRAAKLRAMPMAELLERITNASRIFLEDELPLGSEEGASSQTPEQYVAALSATSGLPHTLCRKNMQKVAGVMRDIRIVLKGLMRGMDPAVLDDGLGMHDGVPVWYVPNTEALGAVLPSNSPGVHSLWVPAIALKTPVILKPGREEPWTPMRIARAMIAAGIPEEAFSLYPTDHEGARAVIDGCGRVLLFGDSKTTAPYQGNPAVETHGPGRSKVLLGADQSPHWREHLDVMIASVSDNGGRSCINASAIYVHSHAEEIAEALAEALGSIEARSASDPEARLAAFANPAFAASMDAAITTGVEGGGAKDLSAAHRGSKRLVEKDGATYLLPTVVHCESLEHPLANTEYLFPFTSVVEVPQDEMLAGIGPTLVLTAITRDPDFIAGLTASRGIQRLNIGPLPTSHVHWDQPHEGNLFEFLYSRRALQRDGAWISGGEE